MVKDLTFGIDVRGDFALFIESKHFKKDGWNLKASTKLPRDNDDLVFIRVIENGKQTGSHGWINCKTKNVEQWG